MFDLLNVELTPVTKENSYKNRMMNLSESHVVILSSGSSGKKH